MSRAGEVAAEVAEALVGMSGEAKAAAAGYVLTAAAAAPRYRLPVVIALAVLGGVVARKGYQMVREAELDRAAVVLQLDRIQTALGDRGGAGTIRP